MTAETNNRLDRLEALAETTLLAIQQLAFQQRDLAVQVRDNQTEMKANITDVVSMIGTLSQHADEDRRLIVGLHSQIVGLQTENRRILDILLNQRRDNEDDPS